MQLVRVRITDAHRADAQRLCDERPTYRGSHRGAPANVVGALGEVLALEFLTGNGLRFVHDDTTTHDLRFPVGHTLDVKTKDRTVAPKAHYECSVPQYNHDHQRPNYYLFVSLQRPRDIPTGITAFHTGYICGAASLAQVDRAPLRRTGDIDPSNGIRFWTACHNLRIDRLVTPRQALQRWLADTQNH